MVTRTPFISITLNRKRLLIFVPLICCLPPPATPFQKSRDCFPFLFLGTFSTLSWFRKEKRRFISFIGRSSSSVNDVTWINTKRTETGGTWPCEDLDSSSRQFWSYIRRSFISRNVSNTTWLSILHHRFSFSPPLGVSDFRGFYHRRFTSYLFFSCSRARPLFQVVIPESEWRSRVLLRT